MLLPGSGASLHPTPFHRPSVIRLAGYLSAVPAPLTRRRSRRAGWLASAGGPCAEHLAEPEQDSLLVLFYKRADMATTLISAPLIPPHSVQEKGSGLRRHPQIRGCLRRGLSLIHISE